MITFTPNAAPVREHNPNHDRIGRFTFGASSGRIGVADLQPPPSAGAAAARDGRVERVSPEVFKASLLKNSRAGTLSDYTPEELSQMQLYKLQGFDAGYAIKGGNELVNLYNSGGTETKGAGAWLVLHAIEQGVTHGDHFDGWLTPFYQKLGFKEVKREKNWTAGGPDVIYIQWTGNPRTARARYRAAGHLDPGGVGGS